MKRAHTLLYSDGTDTYLSVELETCDDYYLIYIEQRDCGVDVILEQQIVSEEELLNLRGAIDYIVKTNKQSKSDASWHNKF